METDKAGLRTRKKQQTRQAISDSATRLFIQHGFDTVTIADIAAAVGVAKMTVTNYFPRKEDLALDAHEEFVTGPARTVTDRPRGDSALSALRRDYLTALERRDPLLGFAGVPYARMLTSSPVLLARLRELHEQRENALATVLAAETAAQPHDITPRAVAAQLGSALRVLFHEALGRTRDGQAPDKAATALADSAHFVFDLLQPALGDYAIRPTG
jgi:AcrR family transcriptional regulator